MYLRITCKCCDVIIVAAAYIYIFTIKALSIKTNGYYEGRVRVISWERRLLRPTALILGPSMWRGTHVAVHAVRGSRARKVCAPGLRLALARRREAADWLGRRMCLGVEARRGRVGRLQPCYSVSGVCTGWWWTVVEGAQIQGSSEVWSVGDSEE